MCQCAFAVTIVGRKQTVSRVFNVKFLENLEVGNAVLYYLFDIKFLYLLLKDIGEFNSWE